MLQNALLLTAGPILDSNAATTMNWADASVLAMVLCAAFYLARTGYLTFVPRSSACGSCATCASGTAKSRGQSAASPAVVRLQDFRRK